MKQFEIKSAHDPETWLKRWDEKVVALDSKNKSAYSGATCFFGTHEKNQLMVYLHKEYANVYLTTRFMGTIEKDGTGSKISGVIGKTKTAIIFLWFMFVMMGAGGIAMIVQQQYQQAVPLFILAAIGLACAVINPEASVQRLEKLLKTISAEEND